jgi:hypothetical protein
MASTASSSETALAEMPATALVEGGTSIPPGLRVSWSERQERLSVFIEVAEPEDLRVHLEDSGQVVVLVWSDENKHLIKLQLRSQIDAAKSRWHASGRGISFELRKMRIGRWNSLVSRHSARERARRLSPLLAQVAGAQPQNVRVDWDTARRRPCNPRTRTRAAHRAPTRAAAQFIDEDEEAELKANPHGHDMFKMRGAMGKEWGSNVTRSVAARQQAAKIDTSKGQPEEDEDEFTMG